MDRIPLALGFGAFGLLSYLGARHLETLQVRMGEFEQAALVEARQAASIETELDRTLAELDSVRAELDSSRAELGRAVTAATRLERAEVRLSDLGQDLEQQGQRLELVARAQSGFDPEALNANLRSLGEELSERWDAVFTMATSAAELAGESQVRLAEIDRELRTDRDHLAMWSSLLGPIVQLAGQDSVGSGVLFRGPAGSDSDERVDYVLTAWHVVRDIQGGPDDRAMPVPVSIYRREREIRSEAATLLEFDAKIDIALLRLDTKDLTDNTARLGRPSRLASLRIFDRVYAVGCPLGNDPIPTLGQVAATQHEVDGQTYLMINAPTYVGNSGGGIFDADTHELLGIFSKVYTHGSLRPTIVTHMGLVTPLDVVYDWMANTSYAFLAPSPLQAAQASSGH